MVLSLIWLNLWSLIRKNLPESTSPPPETEKLLVYIRRKGQNKTSPCYLMGSAINRSFSAAVRGSAQGNPARYWGRFYRRWPCVWFCVRVCECAALSGGSVWAGRVIPVKTYNPLEEQILQRALVSHTKSLVGRNRGQFTCFCFLFSFFSPPTRERSRQTERKPDLAAVGWSGCQVASNDNGANINIFK